MSLDFWAKFALSTSYIVAFGVVWYGYRFRDWHPGDVAAAGLGLTIVLLATLVALLTYSP